jgi:hypothetical protein
MIAAVRTRARADISGIPSPRVLRGRCRAFGPITAPAIALGNTTFYPFFGAQALFGGLFDR